MNTRHTPGPWNPYLFISPRKRFQYWGVGTPERGLIGIASRIDRAEDAQLIAAAPDLLAAGIAILEELNARIEAAPATAKPVFRGIAKLHAAIAKATGGNHA